MALEVVNEVLSNKEKVETMKGKIDQLPAFKMKNFIYCMIL